jgi:hypothetical protein
MVVVVVVLLVVEVKGQWELHSLSLVVLYLLPLGLPTNCRYLVT